MQPIALVLAETFEQARHAARLVKATYNEQKPTTDMHAALNTAFVPNPQRAAKPRGNPAQALQNAPVKIEAEYTIPIEHHNPMEPHGAIAFWENEKLTIFDKTQGVYTCASIWRRVSESPKKTSRRFAVRRRRVRFIAQTELLSGACGDGGA
jgi:xanthine dehydrogenase YagR molybdenum-binding subunit